MHRYLLRQIVATLLMTVSVFTFVLMLGNLIREILPLLNQHVSIGIIAEAFILLIPFLWMYALPMGMLAATLLVFGRFSADQELTAARAGGISLISLIVPIVIFSLGLCGISAFVNFEVGPRCRVEYNRLRNDLKSALADAQLPADRYITFPGNPEYTVYVGKNHKDNLEDIIVYQITDETNLTMKMNAPRGMLEKDMSKNRLLLHLYDASMIYLVTDHQENSLPIQMGSMTITNNLNSLKLALGKPGLSDMTFGELQDELDRVEHQISLPLSLHKSSTENQQEKRRALEKQLSDIAEPIRVQIHRRVAFSFACFGFTLVGIPLGIRMHRRETNVGVAVALLLVAVYYGGLIFADSLSMQPQYAPHLLMWLPGFLFEAVGAVLLWRANRGI